MFREMLRTALCMQQKRSIHKKIYRSVPITNGQQSEEIPISNPATGEIICTVISASEDNVKQSIEKAHQVFQSGIWSKSSTLHRSKVLSKLARLLEERIPELAELETMQTGRTIREMKAQLGRLPEWLDYFSALLRTHTSFVAPTHGKLLNYVERVPLGVVAQIIVGQMASLLQWSHGVTKDPFGKPFNHPLLIAIKKIAPALAAGNSVIVKPSELAPITVLEFEEMATAAGIPPGVLTILPGKGLQTGKWIVQNPLVRKVDITASTSTGRAIGNIVGANLASYTAELGGKAPIIIFEDADLISAVNGTAFASFIASGQTCVSGTRILVQDSIYQEFLSLFLEKVENIRHRMGQPSNPKSMMGTIISHEHLARIDDIVKRASKTASLITGGQRMSGLSDLDGFDLSKGAFYPPTVLTDVNTEDEIWQEEVFGPVVVIKRFKDECEGVTLANATKYGLGAGIWTTNLSRAHRVAAQIESGLCWVNTHHRNDPSSPWGGMKESGIGRENGLEAYLAYTQTKSTIVNIASSEETRETDDWFAETEESRRYG